MSEFLVITIRAMRFLSNVAMYALQWRGAFAVISATFFAATDKLTSEKGEAFLCAEIRPKSLI